MKRELDAKLVKLKNMPIGVRNGMSLALVSYLDVITQDTVLLVPGSPLTSFCNMVVIYMINIFILTWHLIKSSVSMLWFKFFHCQRTDCYYAKSSSDLGLLYWLRVVLVALTFLRRDVCKTIY